MNKLVLLGLSALLLGACGQVDGEVTEESSSASSSSVSSVDVSSESKVKAESESKAKAEAEAKKIEEELSKTQEVAEDETFTEVNDNTPYFTDDDITSTEAYESYGDLDELGRVTAANAVLGVELMPAEERGDISSVKPTGWDQAKYSNVDAGWLYNRAHLIGHQLTGEDANEKNLMTGTKWFNNEGMLPIENFVANYIEETENHVRYRITPVFEGGNLLASGIYMEGFSIEDNGDGVNFNIYVPNRQPGVEIDYSDGSSVGPEGPIEDDELSDLNESSAESSSAAESYVAPEPAPEPEPTPEPESTPAPEQESEQASVPVEPTPAPVEEAPEPTPAPIEEAPAAGDPSSVDANGNGTVTIAEAEAAGYSMPIHSDHWLYPHMIDGDSDGMVGE